jgi:hypothetical protein
MFPAMSEREIIGSLLLQGILFAILGEMSMRNVRSKSKANLRERSWPAVVYVSQWLLSWSVLPWIVTFTLGGGITAMYATDYIVAEVLSCCAIVVLAIRGCLAKEVAAQESKKAIRAIIVVLAVVALVGCSYWNRHVFLSHPFQVVKAVEEKHHKDFASEFSIGYKLFGIANNKFYPFQSNVQETAFLVHWEKQNYSWSNSNGVVSIRLPDIDFRSNFIMKDITVRLPDEIGNSITFRIDPKSFPIGAAVVSDTFEIRSNPNVSDATSYPSCTSPNMVSLGSVRIVSILNSTIVWGTSDCYQGSVDLRGNDVMLNGGLLQTSRADVLEDSSFIRGNKFIGGPRGGYSFPKAGTVIGNSFSNSIFDASRIPNRALVAFNRFSSDKGIYRFGPDPEVSFVVKIVQTDEGGAVLLFGAKPYRDNEDQ